jgi:hypothetical protein
MNGWPAYPQLSANEGARDPAARGELTGAVGSR